MNLFTKFTCLLFFAISLSPACTVEEIGDEDVISISTQVAQGSTEGGAFTTEKALVENRALFGDDGYYFHLYSEDKECGNNLLGDIRFFLEYAGTLETGTYDGSGPFINNSSFFGCDIIIDEVSDTTIKGRVKGGDFDGDKYIEGAFTAELCQ